MSLIRVYECPHADLERLVDERVVEVWSEGAYGSGYLVGGRQALTALHVVAEGVRLTEVRFRDAPRLVRLRGRVLLRVLGETEWWPCRVVWPAPDQVDLYDVALLEVMDEEGPTRSAVRWGRPVTDVTGLGCELTGFPQSHYYETEEAGLSIRDNEHLEGTINPGTGRKSAYLFVRPAHSLAGGTWQGISGAAIRCGELVAGVVIAEKTVDGSLVAQPIVPLLDDQGFSDALADPAVVEAIEFALIRNQPVSSSFSSLAALLRPETQTVRFTGRDAELSDLLEWCEGGGLSLRLMTGSGGQGKTRLAQELGKRLGGAWSFLFLHSDANIEAARRYLERAVAPTLITVDYAETRPRRRAGETTLSQIEQVVAASAGRSGQPPFRVLLIARSAGDWWAQLLRESDASVRPVLRSAKVMALKELAATVVDRHKRFREAWEDLGAALARITGRGQSPPEPPADFDLSHPRYGMALMLHMEALAQLLRPGHPEEQTPESIILEHEEAYWSRAALAAQVKVHGATQRTAVAAASLCGAETRQEAMAVLARLPGLPGPPGDDHARASQWLRDLYPPQTPRRVPFWGSLQPDRLAEALIAEVILDDRSILHPLLGGLAEKQTEQALTVLARAGIHRGELNPMVTSLVATEARLAPPAARVAVATANPEPLIAGLTGLCENSPPIDTLQELVQAIPQRSRRLSRLATEIQQRITAAHREQAAEQPARLARSLANLSSRLEDIGHHQQSLWCLQEAFEILHELAATDDEYRLTLDHITTNLSITLAAHGRHEEALYLAQKAFESSYNSSTDTTQAGDWITALQSLGLRMRELGQGDQALPIIEVIVEIHERFLEESINIGDEREESKARSQLARWLTNLATIQYENGHSEKALINSSRAVELRRLLAEQYRDSETPGLAISLNLHAGILRHLKRPDGLTTAHEAFRLFAGLARNNPAVHLSTTFQSLFNLMQTGTGETSNYTGSVIDIMSNLYAHLRTHHSDAYLPVLNITLAHPNDSRTYMVMDEGTGVPTNLDQADEAVTIYRSLTAMDTTFYQPLLAARLMDLAELLDEAERYEEALSTTWEAVEVQRDLVAERPSLAPHLLQFLSQLCRRLDRSKRYNDASLVAAEAIRVAESVEELDSEEPGFPLAGALNNYFIIETSKGGADIDLVHLRTFTDLYPTVISKAPTEVLESLANTLLLFSYRLCDNDLYSDALTAAKGNAAILNDLVRRDPRRFRPKFARAQLILACVLSDGGAPGAAVRPLVTAISLAQQDGLEELERKAWRTLDQVYRAEPESVRQAWSGTVRAPFPF